MTFFNGIFKVENSKLIETLSPYNTDQPTKLAFFILVDKILFSVFLIHKIKVIWSTGY